MALFLRKFFTASSDLEPARRLYAAIVVQSRQPAFYEHCGVPDSVIGRFDMIALHGFLVMHRLKQGAREQFVLAQALTGIMVEDLDRNLREMGTSDLAVGKKVKRMAQGFYGRLGAYEAGLAGADDVLADALTRNLYAGAAPTPTTLAAMVGYVRREAGALAGQPWSALGQGAVRFGPPPEGVLP